MNYNDYIYDYNILNAKAFYHSKIDDVLTNQLMNVTDPIERKRIVARRSHHRRLYRKYHALAENCWDTMGGRI